VCVTVSIESLIAKNERERSPTGFAHLWTIEHVGMIAAQIGCLIRGQ